MKAPFIFKKRTTISMFLIFQLIVVPAGIIKSMKSAITTFTQGAHPRLGKESPVLKLPRHTLQKISKYITNRTVTTTLLHGKQFVIHVSAFWTVRNVKEEFVRLYNTSLPPGTNIRPISPEMLILIFHKQVMQDDSALYNWTTPGGRWPFTNRRSGLISVVIKLPATQHR